ncbi:MAG TPA: SPOR domain-containing protein [Gammaproteobacteria bacterium]|jgi:cell division septation protein DedD
MEIGLKERLIGAAVLVVLGVIIIPLFLKSSPSPDSTVNQAVSLPAPDSTAAQQQVSLPLTATAAPALAAVTKTPAPAAASKPAVHAISRAAAPAAAASVSQATGKWSVQAGSYGSAANADKAAALLKQHGFHPTVSHFSKAGHTYYRVRVGAYAEHGDADKAAAAVAKAVGGKPEVVPDD